VRLKRCLRRYGKNRVDPRWHPGSVASKKLVPTHLEQTYLEIGKLYVQSLDFAERVHELLEFTESCDFSEVLDFASTKSGKARKKPTCTPGKSQLCGGSCVSLKKECKKNLAGAEKAAADYTAVKAPATKAAKPKAEKAPKTTKPKAAKTAKAKPVEPETPVAVQPKPSAKAQLAAKKQKTTIQEAPAAVVAPPVDQKKKPAEADATGSSAQTGNSQRFRQLQDALKSGDIASLSDVANKIHDDALRVKAKAGDRLDPVLSVLYGESEYGAKPRVVSKEGLDAAVKSGHTYATRGIASSDTLDAVAAAKQFREGSHHPGFGIYGNGTYASYAGSVPDGSFKHGTKADKVGNSDDIAKSYAEGDFDGGVAIKMALSPKASVITDTKIREEMTATKEKIESWYLAEKSKIGDDDGESLANLDARTSRTLAVLGLGGRTNILDSPAKDSALQSDGFAGYIPSGRYAIAAGHDAIAIESNPGHAEDGFINILNRSKLVVGDSSVDVKVESDAEY
jgi:hypothetical protein